MVFQNAHWGRPGLKIVKKCEWSIGHICISIPERMTTYLRTPTPSDTGPIWLRQSTVVEIIQECSLEYQQTAKDEPANKLGRVFRWIGHFK